jgi:putative nucleotidyltransferase with HDIG domain
MTDDGSGGLERLSTRVGQGITGHVAETCEPVLVGDAVHHEFAHQIEGTPSIEESLLAVPLLYGARSVGVIVVSKLGLDQFDADDLRLMEVLAGHASVALVNARLFEAQRREAEIAKALLEFGRELSSADAVNAVFELVAEGSARLLGADHASVWLQREHDGDLECRATAPAGPDQLQLVGVPLPFSLVRPFTNREDPFVIEPADYAEFLRLLPGEETRIFAVAPFVVDGRWGAIAVAAKPDVPFGSRELELLGGVAHQAKLAISTAEGYASLERTFLATVEALANALEAKDEYTSSHTRWIMDMALKVAGELGVDQPTLKRVELGALFHDIGKIGVPAEILAKPGPLTPDERHVIESHPNLGERILAPIEQLEQVRPIVRACHERWDGTGYPDRLQGEEIPLEARIIFACDAFHAMTTDRPYRKALPVDEALRRLAAAAGSQFDPRVINVCLRVLRAPDA